MAEAFIIQEEASRGQGLNHAGPSRPCKGFRSCGHPLTILSFVKLAFLTHSSG